MGGARTDLRVGGQGLCLELKQSYWQEFKHRPLIREQAFGEAVIPTVSSAGFAISHVHCQTGERKELPDAPPYDTPG
jgi:hypothetical protein